MRSSIRPLIAALHRPLASMVICGAGPNLPDELLRSRGQPGFPDPDLFDHFAHSGRRLLTPPVHRLQVELHCMTFILLRPAPDLYNLLSLSAWPRPPRHFIGQGNRHQHFWFSFQHARQPGPGLDCLASKPVQPGHCSYDQKATNVSLSRF